MPKYNEVLGKIPSVEPVKGAVALKRGNIISVREPPETASYRSLSEEAKPVGVFTLRCIVAMTTAADTEHDGWLSATAINDKFLSAWPWLNKHDFISTEEGGVAPVEYVIGNLLNAHKTTGDSLLNQGLVDVRKNEYGFVEVKATQRGLNMVNNLFKNDMACEDRPFNIELLLAYETSKAQNAMQKKRVKVAS